MRCTSGASYWCASHAAYSGVATGDRNGSFKPKVVPKHRRRLVHDRADLLHKPFLETIGPSTSLRNGRCAAARPLLVLSAGHEPQQDDLSRSRTVTRRALTAQQARDPRVPERTRHEFSGLIIHGRVADTYANGPAHDAAHENHQRGE